MKEETLLKIGYEIVIILNGLSIIAWMFLSIFPGFAKFGDGNIIDGLQLIFWNIWFLCFGITLGIGILLHRLVKEEEKEPIEES